MICLGIRLEKCETRHERGIRCLLSCGLKRSQYDRGHNTDDCDHWDNDGNDNPDHKSFSMRTCRIFVHNYAVSHLVMQSLLALGECGHDVANANNNGRYNLSDSFAQDDPTER